MKIMRYFILFLIIINLFFLVGCETSKSEGQSAADENPPTDGEDTGISDVFEDTGEINPPEIPT